MLRTLLELICESASTNQNRRNELRLERFEEFEERLALSATPLSALFGSSLDLQLTITEQPTAVSGDFSTMANAGTAWNDVTYVRSNYGLTGAGQTVAVIDTGIAYNHHAFGSGFGAGRRVVGGWDFAENDANPFDDGPDGFHGTHVSGIIGAQSSTYPGVATGVDLVALRVFDDAGNGQFGWVEQALQWVVQHRTDYANPITTVNLSIGMAWNSNSVPNWANLEDEFLALKNAGLVITVSAGNSFQSYNTPGLSYPAASPYVIPVASVDSNGNMSSFSQRNSRVLAAPGQSITSTVPDYLFSNDGVPNDYAAASGTSMAAPWAAGASVLVRQAMQQVGYANINEDTIYNHLKSTADGVFDSATNATYSRINLRRAIDSLMTSDDFGNSAQAAHSLGTLGATATSLSGRIGNTSDVDYFSFVAGSNGTARFSLQSGTQITGAWQVDGGSSGSGSTFEFNVVQGQTYFVRLGGGATTGNWSLQASVQQPNWGTVDYYLAGGRQATGDTRYAAVASHTGIFTAEAMFLNAAGNVNLEIYNASNQLLGSSNSANDGERVDVNVTAGQQLYVRVTGVNSNVTFRCTNLVSASGDTVTLHGTSGSELFVFLPGSTTSRIAVNGVGYDFASGTYDNFQVQDSGGIDTVVVVGTAQNETVTLTSGSATVIGNNYLFTSSGVENASIIGNGGTDVATLYDTAANDTFTGTPTQSTLTGPGYTNIVYGFSTASAVFTAGGIDQASLYGSVGDDRFEASPNSAFMQGTGFRLNATGYDNALGVGGWGNDIGLLHDTAGDETFVGDPNAGTLTGTGFTLKAANFERVESRSSGGFDTAQLWGSGGSDYFGGSKVLAFFNGLGFSNYVESYDRVTAYGNGGSDTAWIYGTAGNDQFISVGRSRRIQAADYVVQTENFRWLEAWGGAGNDTASLQDLTATDTVRGKGNAFTLANADTATGYGFEQVTAVARSGQRPKSEMQAVDYLFTKSGW